ncbi:hypothetical protein Pelo_1061 [Pelomyxa schiedti]|nr:hypothetical protein Pelo_1061 [Pelomyxa schiedti]
MPVPDNIQHKQSDWLVLISILAKFQKCRHCKGILCVEWNMQRAEQLILQAMPMSCKLEKWQCKQGVKETLKTKVENQQTEVMRETVIRYFHDPTPAELHSIGSSVFMARIRLLEMAKPLITLLYMTTTDAYPSPFFVIAEQL